MCKEEKPVETLQAQAAHHFMAGVPHLFSRSTASVDCLFGRATVLLPASSPRRRSSVFVFVFGFRRRHRPSRSSILVVLVVVVVVVVVGLRSRPSWLSWSSSILGVVHPGRRRRRSWGSLEKG
ncbi:hypothetical protein TYRP_018151 [Tyrophagus putrescentiae]|nr:hypothetical protein TYRP_018151 [Tyrophagus putrescentiae]